MSLVRVKQLQRWLDYYGPFEAIVDGANVGLYSQRKFRPSRVSVGCLVNET